MSDQVEKTQIKNNIHWINCAKFIAICAVMVDHTYLVLYVNQGYQWSSFFSVSLFIILSGITAYYSDLRHNDTWFRSIIRKSQKIVLAYGLCVFIYLVVISHFFDLKSYFVYLFGFNISGPHYFVLLYLQLILVDYICFQSLSFTGKKGVLIEIAVFIIMLFVSYFTTNYSNILDVYGGGGKLFGGTYLVLYYLGMIIAKHDLLEGNKIKSLFLLLIGAGIYVITACHLWRFRNSWDMKIPFGAGVNPPSISLSLLACGMLLCCAGLFQLLEQWKGTSWIVTALNWLGSHTLYIFLYHRLFLDYFLSKLITKGWNIWIYRIVFYSIMILGPIAIETVIRFLRKGMGTLFHGKELNKLNGQ